MPKYKFTITYDTTMSALVTIEAKTIEAAHERAVNSEDIWRSAHFTGDDCTGPVYIPDAEEYEVIPDDGKSLLEFLVDKECAAFIACGVMTFEDGTSINLAQMVKEKNNE